MRNNSTWTRSAPSRISWEPDAWSIWSIVLTAVGVVACMIVPAVLYIGILAAFVGIGRVQNDQGQLLIAQALTYLPWAAFLLLVLPRISRATRYELGLRAPTARDLLIGAGGAAVMYAAVTLVGTALTALLHSHETETAIKLLHDLTTPFERILYAIVAIVLAPMLEELTFRVFLFNALTRYVDVPAAAVVSGIVFGLVHANPQPGHLVSQLLTVSLPLAVGGYILAYVYATTRSYWASVTTHALFNSVAVIAVMVFHAN